MRFVDGNAVRKIHIFHIITGVEKLTPINQSNLNLWFAVFINPNCVYDANITVGGCLAVSRLDDTITFTENLGSTLDFVNAGTLGVNHFADGLIEIVCTNSTSPPEWGKNLDILQTVPIHLFEKTLHDLPRCIITINCVLHDEVISILQVSVIVIDGIRIQRNTAIACLTENRIQHGCWNHLAADHRLVFIRNDRFDANLVIVQLSLRSIRRKAKGGSNITATNSLAPIGKPLIFGQVFRLNKHIRGVIQIQSHYSHLLYLNIFVNHDGLTHIVTIWQRTVRAKCIRNGLVPGVCCDGYMAVFLPY